jgi:MFS superfamily sulfate permease-like transporter
VLTRLFSNSFISGYTTGSAIHVLVSQLKDLFGIKNAQRFNGAFKIPKTIFDIVVKLGTTNIGTLSVSIICIIFIIIFKEIINPRIKKRWKIEFPSELILVSI